MSQFETWILASIVCSTDPVAVAPKNVYAYVMGESALNDVVSVVLYRMMLRLYRRGETELTSMIWAEMIGEGVIAFAVAVGIGLLVAAVVTLIASRRTFWDSAGEGMLLAQLLVWPFWCYAVCEVFECSGIVGIMVTGLAMARYTIPFLSSKMRATMAILTSTLAHTMETFVSIYFGMALSSIGGQSVGHHTLGFAGLAAVAVILARGVVVAILCTGMNRCRSVARRFGWRHQRVLWASGLRGSIAFALVSSARRSIKNEQIVHVMEIATITVTLVTLVIGVIFVPCGLSSCETFDKDYESTRGNGIASSSCVERFETGCLLPQLQRLNENE